MNRLPEPTRREKDLLRRLCAEDCFIWYAMGKSRGYNGYQWQYPVICEDRKMTRIFRVMLERLISRGWVEEEPRSVTHSHLITQAGREAAKAFGVRKT